MVAEHKLPEEREWKQSIRTACRKIKGRITLDRRHTPRSKVWKTQPSRTTHCRATNTTNVYDIPPKSKLVSKRCRGRLMAVCIEWHVQKSQTQIPFCRWTPTLRCVSYRKSCPGSLASVLMHANTTLSSDVLVSTIANVNSRHRMIRLRRNPEETATSCKITSRFIVTRKPLCESVRPNAFIDKNQASSYLTYARELGEGARKA